MFKGLPEGGYLLEISVRKGNICRRCLLKGNQLIKCFFWMGSTCFKVVSKWDMHVLRALLKGNACLKGLQKKGKRTFNWLFQRGRAWFNVLLLLPF